MIKRKQKVEANTKYWGLIFYLLLSSCQENRIEYRKTFFEELDRSLNIKSDDVVLFQKAKLLKFNEITDKSKAKFNLSDSEIKQINDFEMLNYTKLEFPSVRLVDSIYLDSIFNRLLPIVNKEYISTRDTTIVNLDKALNFSKKYFKRVISYSKPYFFSDSTRVLIYKSVTTSPQLFGGAYVLYEYDNNSGWQKKIELDYDKW